MLSDTNGRPVSISFRVVLVSIIAIGFVATALLALNLADHNAAERIAALAELRRQSQSASTEHAAIDDKLTLMVVTATFRDPRDLEQIRAALIPQLSPALRAVFERLQREKDERELTSKGTQRQIDESPDNTGRPRRTPR